MIRARLDCDVHRIEAADPYPDDYEATVRRNVREQDADARPRHRQPAALDRALRHDPAGQPDLERPGADDHDDVRRALRLRGQDRAAGHDARHERPRERPPTTTPSRAGARGSAPDSPSAARRCAQLVRTSTPGCVGPVSRSLGRGSRLGALPLSIWRRSFVPCMINSHGGAEMKVLLAFYGDETRREGRTRRGLPARDRRVAGVRGRRARGRRPGGLRGARVDARDDDRADRGRPAPDRRRAVHGDQGAARRVRAARGRATSTRRWRGRSGRRGTATAARPRSARSWTTRRSWPRPERATAVERAFREHFGRAVAALIRAVGDWDVAEEAVQDAFATALARWPQDGVPRDPLAWIVAVARNRAIDRLRRERALRTLAPELLPHDDARPASP